MPPDEPVINDYDAFWKEALDAYLPDFLQLVAPAVFAAIDWQQGYTSLDTELQALFPVGRRGRRFVDRLYEVTLGDGSKARLLLHLEVQVGPDRKILRRIHVYRFRIAAKLRAPVYTLLVLADDDPQFRPSVYQEQVLDLRLRLEVPVIKLLDFKDDIQRLEQSDNPFSLLLLAWFGTRASRPDRKRLAFKIRLVELLRAKGYDRERIRLVFRLLDWLVRLPEDLPVAVIHGAARRQGEQSKSNPCRSCHRPKSTS